MCYEDRTKKNFTDMTWVHVQKSFSHAKKEDAFNGRKNSTMSYVVQVCERIQPNGTSTLPESHSRHHMRVAPTQPG